MSDKIDVTAESWRTPRRRSGVMDPQMIRMGAIAAGFAGVVALGVGGYSWLGHRPHGVPVIEADSRPIRVRPDNPGGATVEGGEEQVMGGNGHAQADAMAPPIEAPAPQALRAQIEAAHAPPPPAPPPAPPPTQTASLPAPPAAAPAAISDVPEPRPGNHPPPRPPAAATGGTQVQLGALESEQAAMVEWQRLSRRMPELLGKRQPAVLRAEHSGKPIWRLRTGGFTDVAAATAFCSQVRAKGVGCAIASF